MPGVSEAVRDALAPLANRPDARVCVALSGGLDSTVLLHVIAALGSCELRAVYVNHQLHPDAAAWGRRCEALCKRLGVVFRQETVAPDATAGEGLEAAARRVRYEALAASLAEGEILATAHHRDDQVETVLLNLLRGSGVTGLGGVPRSCGFGRGFLLRPLLEVARADLLDYARSAGLEWIEDPSNTDLRMDRNYLRHEVLPVLRVRWPGVALTIGRSGRLCAEASGLLEEVGAEDARRICRAQRVLLGRLAALSAPRQRNVLRYLCRSRLGSAPSERRLREGLAQLLAAGHDRNPVLAWPGGEIRRYRTALYLLPPTGPRPADPREALPVVAGATLDLGARLGTMRLVGTRGQGLSKRRVGDSLRVSFRHGGERLKPAGSGHRQKLKKLLQERGIVPWMRERIPLLYADSRLVAVAHLWVAAEFVADAGERGFRVRWDGHPELE